MSKQTDPQDGIAAPFSAGLQNQLASMEQASKLHRHDWLMLRRHIAEALASSGAVPPAPLVVDRDATIRREMRAYLDKLTITSDNIGGIRRSLFLPWDSAWNGWVREDTADREKSSASLPPASPSPPSAEPQQAKVEMGTAAELARQATPEHRCGVRGFADSGDVCPGCAATGRTPSAEPTLADDVITIANESLGTSAQPCRCGSGPCLGAEFLLTGFACIRVAGLAALDGHAQAQPTPTVSALRDCEEERDRQTEAALTSQRHIQGYIDQASALRSALEQLVTKIDAVHADPQYASVWTMAHVHGCRYTGLQYGAELDAAKASLASSPPLAPSVPVSALQALSAEWSSGSYEPIYAECADELDALITAAQQPPTSNKC